MSIDGIAFIHSDQPTIDRGWNTRDVEEVLAGLNLSSRHVNIPDGATGSALRKEVGGDLCWPASYTVGARPDGPLLVELLDQLGLPYVGPSGNALRLNSKLKFKSVLTDAGISTPAYRPLPRDTEHPLGLGWPCMVKTEYSCNSQGVALVKSDAEAGAVAASFRARYGQQVFVEAWTRQHEYTVAYLPTARGPAVAPMQMNLLGGKPYIDEEAKADNHFLEFALPDPAVRGPISDLVKRIARVCAINGHFRLDIVGDVSGELFPIDLNFLPAMSADPQQVSYFPAALDLACGLNFEQVVCEIVAGAVNRFALRLPAAAQRIVNGSGMGYGSIA